MSAVTADTIVTHCSSKNSPLITVVPSSSAAGPSGGVPSNPGGGVAATSGESMVQVHHSTESQMSTGGQRVALVTSQTNPNKISIVPADQIPTSTKTSQPPISSIVTSSSSSATSKVANNPVGSDENSINEANRMPKPQQVGTDLKKKDKTNAFSKALWDAVKGAIIDGFSHLKKV